MNQQSQALRFPDFTLQTGLFPAWEPQRNWVGQGFMSFMVLQTECHRQGTGEEQERDLITSSPAAGKQIALQAAAPSSAGRVQVSNALRFLCWLCVQTGMGNDSTC